MSMTKLEEIGRLIRSQDNRATAQPVFCVQQRKRIYGIDSNYTETFTWLHEGEEVDASTAQQLERCRPRPEKTAAFTRVGYVDVWEFVTASFTLKGCEDYLAVNGHNLKEPRIYVASGYRNAEWIALREFLHAQRSPEDIPNWRAKNPREGDLFVKPELIFQVRSYGDGVVWCENARRGVDATGLKSFTIEDWHRFVDLTVAGGARFIADELNGNAATAAEVAPAFKSCAIWPPAADVPFNFSEDTHTTHAQAAAVCTMLVAQGLGGSGKFFPVMTWTEPVSSPSPAQKSDCDEDEELINQCFEVLRADPAHAGIASIQRRLRLGYTRAARIMDELELRGLVGPMREGGLPREIIGGKAEQKV